jgi:G:T-mismatch repair DNA endonuclease (very short patch repair protein)
VPDRISPEARSEHMRRIWKVDAKPELVVRRAAHHLRFLLDVAGKHVEGTAVDNLYMPSVWAFQDATRG